MGYEDSLNLYQAFNQNPVNFVDPFGLDSDAGWIAASINKSYGSLRKYTWKDILRSIEGGINAAIQTALWLPKLQLLIPRLLTGIDLDVNINISEKKSIINFELGKSDRKEMIKEALVLPSMADYVSKTGTDAYFGYIFRGGDSILGEEARGNMARHVGEFAFFIGLGKFAKTGFGGSRSTSIVPYDVEFASSHIISFPENLQFARSMPLKYAKAFKKGIGKFGAGNEVWITAADDILGINTQSGMQLRLSLYSDYNATISSYTDSVVTFKIKNLNNVGLRSPIETVPPRGYGYVYGGRTRGLAREWIINNGTAEELGIFNIRIRKLKKNK
jgi:hypothetical protein